MWDSNPRGLLHFEISHPLLPQRSPLTSWVILLALSGRQVPIKNLNMIYLCCCEEPWNVRPSGIEPEFTVWKTAILPLNYRRGKQRAPETFCRS